MNGARLEPPPQSLQSSGIYSLLPGLVRGPAAVCQGGWPLGGLSRLGKAFPIISLGLVLAAPKRSMTRPTHENGRTRAASAVPTDLASREEFSRSPSVGHLHPTSKTPTQRSGALERAVL